MTHAEGRGQEPDRQARLLHGAIQLLVRRFALSERADVSCCGLTVAQAVTLDVLRREGPVRLGSLGRRLGIAPSTLSRNLDRLVETGLVAREADPEDARAARVRLTPSGETAAAEVARQELLFARSILDRIPAGQRGELLTSLELLLRAVREATEVCCPGAFDHLMEGFPQAGACAGGSRDEDCCG